MSIKNRSIIHVNQELDLMQKKVRQLNTQLSTQQQRNNVMQHRIKEIQRINPHRDKSPLQQLQEHLNMERQLVQEIFKPMKGSEYQYMRNQRIKTEQDLMQSRQFEIQQKRNKVMEIDNQEQQIPIKRAEFAQKKILQAKLLENLFNERTQHLASLKKKEISKLQQQEEVIATQLFRYNIRVFKCKKGGRNPSSQVAEGDADTPNNDFIFAYSRQVKSKSLEWVIFVSEESLKECFNKKSSYSRQRSILEFEVPDYIIIIR